MTKDVMDIRITQSPNGGYLVRDASLNMDGTRSHLATFTDFDDLMDSLPDLMGVEIPYTDPWGVTTHADGNKSYGFLDGDEGADDLVDLWNEADRIEAELEAAAKAKVGVSNERNVFEKLLDDISYTPWPGITCKPAPVGSTADEWEQTARTSLKILLDDARDKQRDVEDEARTAFERLMQHIRTNR